ncbi:hypothetical protein RIR_jg2951.t1 [Rhizophagus irregularis DAOM 181602=DAOM 197198]|uniref:Uncharacterized protein n=1 Tax=Rhizophagus irregularis (strain DAOM 197198w) TaxID=1432141 RepID=A0A015JW41_RHIIW|nr:hypothetical protein RirG_190140 [Rhizophagus irregularis DAOM 197198w]GET64941.1 hypothetical protein RIR_jg2951.t1 [Rhizophagus irregularis DAOM 181602=DAOM 197198]
MINLNSYHIKHRIGEPNTKLSIYLFVLYMFSLSLPSSKFLSRFRFSPMKTTIFCFPRLLLLDLPKYTQHKIRHLIKVCIIQFSLQWICSGLTRSFIIQRSRATTIPIIVFT